MNDSTARPPEEHSKSKRKREVLALQTLGEVLVNLPESQLNKIPLDSTLLKAIQTARGLTSHEAKRRQLQYIGKLMREVDPQPIQDFLQKIEFNSNQNKALFHQIERFRDQLIAEGDEALQAFLDRYPAADRQQLRQLIRNAQKTGHARELFRYLRNLLDS